MKQHVKFQGHASLREEMKAVARGERAAPQDAGEMTFDSVEALLCLLTPQNRQLLAVIRDKKPQSIAELAELTGRAPSNLTRTLGKLEAIGFVQMKNVDRRKVPTTTVHSFRINIDPFSQNDQLEFA
ncbi:MAG: MarR family transcriptional regulator [Ferrovum sp.]|jgi:predicted transcriptional regulator|nr:MarR family transcriptional regulator [Ferrovum sp.]